MTAQPLDAARDALIAVLAERNSALEARVSEMEDRVARVERAMSRNSGNFSMAPSGDDQPGKKPPRPKPQGQAGRTALVGSRSRRTTIPGTQSWTRGRSHIPARGIGDVAVEESGPALC